MSAIEGSRTVEIDAAVDRCRAIVADVEHAPEWQHALRSVRVLERDDEGRAALVETEWDARLRTLKATLRMRYADDGVAFSQERGDLRALDGSWTLADAGAGRTRATYALRAEVGGMLAMLLGAAEQQVRDHLLDDATAGLAARAEGR